jgi:hypothetical protein
MRVMGMRMGVLGLGQVAAVGQRAQVVAAAVERRRGIWGRRAASMEGKQRVSYGVTTVT